MTRSQQELEQPAKVYQLDAVDRKVDQALSMLQTISNNVSGVVTETQMEKRLKEVRDEIEDDYNLKITNEIKTIHLKYGPTYKGIWWVISTMAVGLIGIFWAMINNLWRGQ